MKYAAKEGKMAINLQKGQKVSLKKNTSAGLGEILVNLNWNSKPANRGFLASLFAQILELILIWDAFMN